MWSALHRLHRRRWNTVISLADTLERRSPRHSAAAHHGSGSGLGRGGFELQRHPEGLCVSSEVCKVNYGVSSTFIIKLQSRHLKANFGTKWKHLFVSAGVCRFIGQNVQVCFKHLSTTCEGAAARIPRMLSTHLQHVCILHAKRSTFINQLHSAVLSWHCSTLTGNTTAFGCTCTPNISLLWGC